MNSHMTLAGTIHDDHFDNVFQILYKSAYLLSLPSPIQKTVAKPDMNDIRQWLLNVHVDVVFGIKQQRSPKIFLEIRIAKAIQIIALRSSKSFTLK